MKRGFSLHNILQLHRPRHPLPQQRLHLHHRQPLARDVHRGHGRALHLRRVPETLSVSYGCGAG